MTATVGPAAPSSAVVGHDAEVLGHLTTAADWRTATTTGALTPPSLATEGFVHLSTPAQVEGVAARFFADTPDVVLCVVDPARLTAALRFEGPIDPRTGRPEVLPAEAVGDGFPHLYGPLPLSAVVRALPWAADPDGIRRIPPGAFSDDPAGR
jgi:uncharacterized protein (DUF952 family)